ncbi:MAG: hypothetical protein KatS3mg100_531 [Candidatus Parcubacteria bacterium]|nr:MAG: hypothetical protein KatS3mg100_531 [Candidatus Parcubacteria bacterium]
MLRDNDPPSFEDEDKDFLEEMWPAQGAGDDFEAEIPQLVLYVKEGCPFCAKVERFADDAGIPLMYRDITDPANGERLLRLGGKRQVPFLVDEARGVQMYESDDIIAYLEEHYAEGA